MLESILRNFTAQVSGLEGMDYWERLKALNLLFQDRRRERGRIIFMWKTLQGYVSGYEVCDSYSERRGRLITIPPFAKKFYCLSDKRERGESEGEEI